MHPYDPNHYKFLRNSRLKRSDFRDNDPPPNKRDKVVFWAAMLIAVALSLFGAW